MKKNRLYESILTDDDDGGPLFQIDHEGDYIVVEALFMGAPYESASGEYLSVGLNGFNMCDPWHKSHHFSELKGVENPLRLVPAIVQVHKSVWSDEIDENDVSKDELEAAIKESMDSGKKASIRIDGYSWLEVKVVKASEYQAMWKKILANLKKHGEGGDLDNLNDLDEVDKLFQ